MVTAMNKCLCLIGFQNNEDAKNPANNQMATRTEKTRLVVTISRYLKWKYTAMYRSKLIAAIVITETQASRDSVMPHEANVKHLMLRDSFTLATRNAANNGSPTVPTARSVRTRLPSKSFDGKCKEVFFGIADKTKMFATVVTRARRTFKEAFTR